MGLFFDVLSAINNPSQQGSVTQLENITSTMQQLATTQGLDASKMQSILAAAGGMIGPAMQNRQGSLPGENQLGNLLGQITGTGAPATALSALFPPQVQQQLIQGVAQKAGINASMIQGMLPTLLPAIMGLLNMGSSSGGGTNSLLTSFLSGNNDLGEVFKFANRFLNPA
ncbi:DUF937 domain-containing protein [Leptolyngbya ohadii]|uniref:DUF937 domain-containing protein n=1 Tax=Leptolyngbya ohadii TaxID=1962290 RepID=UPI000B59B957|nr:DUF937 domain-containing protein [Leptolyngbya ohadii]